MYRFTAFYLAIKSSVDDKLKRERGDVTIGNVLWAIGVMGFATVVIAAIKSYVESKAGKIK